MTTLSFRNMPAKDQMNYLKKRATLLHRIVKGNMIVSLYWSKEFVFEVLSLKNNINTYEIKCFDRFDYIHS